jgi:hypothetical protein
MSNGLTVDRQGRAPLELARRAITPFEHVLGVRSTKKSLVSTSGRLVKTPCFVCPTLVFKTRMSPASTVISSAVKVSSCAKGTVTA